MDREGNYLQIPPVYALWLEGLRWARNGEAVEYADAQTFALSPQLALFLEGFAGRDGLLNFGQVLHLFHLLGYGRMQRAEAAQELATTFARAGRPLRNAGALCSFLCRDFPAAAGKLDAKQVCGLLWSSALLADLVFRWETRTHEGPEAPPLAPSLFEKNFLDRLASLPRAEWEHWLRHGCGSPGEAVEELAREIVPEKPRQLQDVLEALAQRERLSDALPYVAQLVSVLALPPRRLARQELPVGGYADVTTRGLPERLLPSQFALDDLEFIRRFAENELLFFRREEPTRHVREELVVILDQGVRTWGLVRLVLSAAVLAFGKLAARRKLAFRVATTAADGTSLDPLAAGDELMGRLVETSDLSPHPGLALERVLEEPADVARDVVLLSHPRSLREADVQAAARRAVAPTRLFALTVNDQGQAELAEFRHGAALPVRQFRVELNSPGEPQPAPLVADVNGWTGDVEPVPYPFRFGVSNASPLHFDFDESGQWLLLASSHGMLHAFKLDGSVLDILPRGMTKDGVLTQVEQVLGVRGGFAVCGRVGTKLAVAHYDLGARRCSMHVLVPNLQKFDWPRPFGLARKWYYFPQFHSVVVDCARPPTGESAQPGPAPLCVGVDLATGSFHPPRKGGPGRAQQACEATGEFALPPPELPILFSATEPCKQPHVRQHRSRQALEFFDGTTPTQRRVPLLEGAAVLEDGVAYRACTRGPTLAVALHHPAGPKWDKFWLFRLLQGSMLNAYEDLPRDAQFMLSHDGRLLARQMEQTQVEVREVGSGSLLFTTLKGKSHQRVQVRLGKRYLHATVGRWHHFVQWASGNLEVFCAEGPDDPGRHFPRHLGLPTAAVPEYLPAAARYDPSRFVAGALVELGVAVDGFGQIALFDKANRLLCMFFVFRNHLAGWMPDGTRFGPAGIIGGQELVSARHRFGQVLRAASEGEKVVP